MPKNELVKEDPSDDQFEDIIEQFQTAMLALQMQDTQSSEQAFFKAKLIYSNIDLTDTPEENDYLKLIIAFIEVTSKFLKSNFYIADERFNKALEALVSGKNICEESVIIFDRIPPTFIEDDEYGLFGILEFMFAYFRHLIIVMERITKASVEIQEGKYVDEIAIFRRAAGDLRMFNFQNFYNDNNEINNLITGSVGLLNRIADTYEKRAERLEEKRKVIEFSKPIDKKVFIVHGHNEGVLRELKEMLEKSFKISPIILRDEIDYGKTLIEKIENYGRLCAFAFVIITPDDIVENKKKKSFQARPNVLFELGWFCGRYGRKKVRILRQKDTPLPSDLNGIVTVDFTDKIEEVYRRIQLDLETENIL